MGFSKLSRLAVLMAATLLVSSAADVAADEPMVSIDAKNVSLLDLTLRMSDLTGENFVLLDSDLENETLTIYAPNPVPLSAAREIFISALRLSGYGVVEEGAYWKIDKEP
ncbi:MAG: hypothetical protein AUK47_02210 [Deltaproteobacteria bacterium CG2_30_63_29]|nr:MAG: hypothetical protein AUK47_02210 [Deltaproteobacteria bacterium CG2_30_63_29]PJB40588.1 MAG: hypothetical protein CO108_14435 [Deltaproteobacteria bacterium CG_4_9_14_3_um_filter_63_12]